MFSKHRLEALSDGIFAIVMTLLVLDLKVPEGPLPKHFGMMLAQQWVSFIITFVIACSFWTLQHKIFALVDDIHQKTLVVTFVFLGLISVLPFSTALLGHRIYERSSFVVYYAHAFLIGAALTVKLHMLLRMQAPKDWIAVDLLKIRLYTVLVIMGALMLASAYLPVNWMGIVAALVAVGSRLVTKKRKDALEALQKDMKLGPGHSALSE